MKLVTKIIHDNTTLDSKNKIKHIDVPKVREEILREVLRCLRGTGMPEHIHDNIADNLTELFKEKI